MDNYTQNKNKVLDDYYKCIGAYRNCKSLYNNKNNYQLKRNDTEEEKLIKKGIEEDILSNLGKVGEKAFKYIIGLEKLKITPNADLTSFEEFFKKTGPLKEFAEKHGISREDERIKDLLDYEDENHQKSHNFDYWYTVLETITPKITQKFKKYIEYKAQSNMLIYYCNHENEFEYENDYYKQFSLPLIAAVFPKIIEYSYDNVPTLTKKQLKFILATKRESIKQSGDIFTRLRYSDNNKTNKTFNLTEINNLINLIIGFVEMIHENNDDLDFDLDLAFSKKRLKTLKEIFEISDKEIDNIYSLNLPVDEYVTIFSNNIYSYASIKRILDLGLTKEELFEVMQEQMHAKDIKPYLEKGIRDFRKIREIIDEYNEGEEYIKTRTI